jgi:hypothetical protein
MHLVRDDAMAALVHAIDRAIDTDNPPRRVTPVLRGTIDEFEDWAGAGTTLLRYVTPRGVPTLRNMPTHLLTPKVRAAFYDLFVAIEEAEAMLNASPA